MKIKIADILPNPFRELGTYPVRQDKVDVLKASIGETGFWDNVLLRAAPDKPGKYECAYGHSRMEALRQLAAANPKAKQYQIIDVPVKKLDNDMMAKIMARENMEDWATSPQVEQDTLASIIHAYGRGELHLPEPKGRKDQYRYAPNFNVATTDLPPHGVSSPYTIDTLTAYLGWNRKRVEGALNALALIEQGVAEPKDFAGLSHRQARIAAEETRAELNRSDEENAKRVLKGVTEKQREQNEERVQRHKAKDEADFQAGRGKHEPKSNKSKPRPNLDQFVGSLIQTLSQAFTSETKKKLDEVIKNKEHMSDDSHDALLRNLRAIAETANGYADKLTGDRKRMKIVNSDSKIIELNPNKESA